MKNTLYENLFKKIKKFSKNNLFYRKILLTSALTFSITGNPNVISQSLIDSISNESYSSSNRSFITKAVEKTGASVVTIDTQRLVGRKQFPRGSNKLW